MQESRPQSTRRKIVLVAVAIGIASLGVFTWYGSIERGSVSSSDTGTVKRGENLKALDGADDIHPGYNSAFDDSVLVQTRWIGRAADIIDMNLPDYATRAVVKEPFFHRGFKNKATICGEVQFYRDDDMVMDFQRFVFPGGYVVHYENDVKNFQIYWDKVCTELDPAN